MMLAWDAVAVGQRATERVVGPMTVSDIVRYQGASGDFHPAHHDAAYAREHGYRDVFSLGLLSAGYLTVMASDWFGAANLRRFASRFNDVVWPGDTLICRCEVSGKRSEGGIALADLTLRCLRDDDVVVSAQASYQIKLEE